MAICSKCGHNVSRTVTIFRPDGDREYCRVCLPSPHPDKAKNLFQNFTMDHVRNEQGKKVTVNSLAELRAAEKRYGVALACMSDSDGSASEPPQHDKGAGDLSANYVKKFNRDPAAYSQSEIDKCKSDVGAVQDKSQTLVNLPNPLNR